MAYKAVKIPWIDNMRVLPEQKDYRIPGEKQVIPQEATDNLNKRLREASDEVLVEQYYHEEEFIKINENGEKQIVKRLVPNDGEEIYCR